MFHGPDVFSVWDARLIRKQKNFRQKLSKQTYKSNRDKDRNATVYKHEDLTVDLLETLGVRNMYPGVLEGDDVIAWLCKRVSGRKVIVSADQDMLQLIDDKTIVYSPIKDIIIDKNNFEDVVGVPLDQFIRYKALMGDKSDNIPGLHKCGPKTASKMIKQFPTDELLREECNRDDIDQYFTNLKLVDLNQGTKEHPEDLPIYEEQYDKLVKLQPDFTRFETIARGVNMNAVVDRMDEWRQVFDNKQLINTLENIVNRLNLK